MFYDAVNGAEITGKFGWSEVPANIARVAAGARHPDVPAFSRELDGVVNEVEAEPEQLVGVGAQGEVDWSLHRQFDAACVGERPEPARAPGAPDKATAWAG